MLSSTLSSVTSILLFLRNMFASLCSMKERIVRRQGRFKVRHLAVAHLPVQRLESRKQSTISTNDSYRYQNDKHSCQHRRQQHRGKGSHVFAGSRPSCLVRQRGGSDVGAVGRRRIEYRRASDQRRRAGAEQTLVPVETKPDGPVEPADEQRLAAVGAVERVVGDVELVQSVQTAQ